MSTSLAEQLQKLAVPQTAVLKRDKKRASLLFDPKEAATLTRETVYQIGLEGFEELKSRNDAFAYFEGTLFHVTSKDFERSVQDLQANEMLDKNIRKFLLLLSPYFLLRCAHQALEWLIHRYSIHEYNKDELVLLILPYHETNIFVRALQLMQFKESSDVWIWLKPLQKPGIHLPKLTLYNHAAGDPHLLKLISNYLLEAVKLHENPNILTVLFNFYCLTFTGSLEYSSEINEAQVTQMLRVTLKGLTSEIVDFCSASYVILAKLISKTQLSDKLLNKLVDRISEVRNPELKVQVILLLVALYQTQKQFTEISQVAIQNLSEKVWLAKVLQDLMATDNFLTPLLRPLCQKTIKSGLLEVACSNSKVFLNELMKEIKFDDEFVAEIMTMIGNSYKPNKEKYPEETKQWLRDLLWKIETQYPAVFDKEFNRIMKTKQQKHFQELLGNTEDKMTVLQKLHHPVPGIRQAAIKYVIKRYKSFKHRDKEFFSNAVLSKLRDESFEVVSETLALSKAILPQLLNAESLMKVLTELLTKAQREKNLWWGVTNPALEILCDIVVVDDVPIFLTLLPFLLPTDEDELRAARVIIYSAYMKKCEFLRPLENQLRKAENADKFFAVIFDSLSISAHKPDIKNLVSALKQLPEISGDVVHKFLASLLLCSSLEENCQPEMSSLVLDVLLAYLDGEALHVVKSDLTVSNYLVVARKGKFPLQGFLHCLNMLILKTRRGKNRMGLYDFNQNNEAAKFYSVLLDVLLRGSYTKKENVSLMYAESLKIYFGHFCDNFKSKIELFLNVSAADCVFISPALQLRCSHSVASLLGVKHENISTFFDLSEVIMPYILISLTNSHKEIRLVAVNLAQILLSIIGSNNEGFTPLVKLILKNKEEIIMDENQATMVASNLLKDAGISNAFLNLISTENHPIYLRAKIAEILSHSNDFELRNKTSNFAVTILKETDAKENLNRQQSLIVCSCLKNIGSFDLAVKSDTYELLELAIRRDACWVLNTNHSEEEKINLAVFAINQIDKIFDGFDADVRSALLNVVIEVAAETQNPEVLSTSAHFFKHINLNADLVVMHLMHMRDVQSAKSLISLKRKRRVSIIPSADILDTLAWRKGVTVLEFLQNKKKIEKSHVLLPLLFDLLKKCLDFDEQAIVEYVKQLLLSSILNLCDKIEEQNVPENVFNIESIVQCIRASPNPQTHHHALLVLARSSRFLPRQVLHHVMAIFTFMGSSVLRHDDAYSFQIINKIVDTIVPILAEESDGKIVEILRVFVDAILDVPEHRRNPLYTNLLERLGTDNLHVFLLLMFEAHVAHPSVVKQEQFSPPKRLDVAKNLALEFEAEIVVGSCVKLVEYLRALPGEKEEVDSVEIFNIAHHTPKQFRHYRYLIVTFIVGLLTSPEFVNNKIATLDDSQLLQMEPIYKTLIINILMYIQAASKLSEKNSNTPHAQYWKVMLHHSYDVLDSVNALLTPQMFLLVIRGLTTHKLPTIQRRSLELLNSKLQHDSEFFNDCEDAEMYAMIPPLINIIKQIESELDSEQELIVQTAILSLKLFVKRLAKEQPEKFVQILEFVTNLVKTKQAQSNILASLILCLAELCSNLRAFAIPSLSKFMPVVIKLLKIQRKHEENQDLLLLSCITAVQKIIDSLPLFLSPYLEKLLCELSSISGKFNDPKLATFTQKLSAIRQKLGSSVPPRILIPIIDAAYKKLISKNKFSNVTYLMAVLTENLSHLKGAEIQNNLPELTAFFLNALQFRADNSLLGSSVYNVEACVIKSLVALVLKLSESTFRPLYYKIYDWAVRSDVRNERVVTFYALSSEVAQSLKGLFVLFAGHFLNNASSILDACNVIKTKNLYFKDEVSKNVDLLENVLKTLHAVCLYDSQKFINKERFDVLMQPLVDQLENTLGGVDSLINRANTLVIPCIVQFSVAAGDDALWKQLNYQILLKARHQQPEIRLIALECLHEIVRKLGEDFMPLLPETIPFLAELLEDDEEKVEKACQKAIQDMEKILGEPLQKYF